MTCLRAWYAIALGVLPFLTLPALQAQAGPPGGGVVFADLDGDGDDDVVFSRPSNNEVAYWLLEDGAIVAGGGLGAPGTYVIRAAGKIDGDSVDDLVIQDSASGDVLVWYMQTTGGAVTVKGGAVTATGLTAYDVLGVGQFNPGTDAIPDLLLQNPTSTEVVVWQLNAGGGVIGGGTVGTPGGDYDVLAPGDVDGDGTSDIVFRNLTNQEIAFWELNDGSTAVQRGSGFGAPTSFEFVSATSSFNSDQISDLAFKDTGSGNVYIWFLFSDAVTPPQVDSGATVANLPAYAPEGFGTYYSTNNSLDLILVTSAGGISDIVIWDLNEGAFAGGGYVGSVPDSYSVTNQGPQG